ncbi:uncharacterized protein LOC122377085 [Amphibalanus amphitrite]|uniref:uncharacterized protein LOC122377085 n=1 Tax=Amphibalanus amphitrite TaxID=1232801 RepID=UPI001C900B18|nr:uncharacterized protein LOC122377085 [Amphibalanus amphitrite]
MLDYRSHDDEEETYLSCRDLSTDGGRDFRLGSVSSYASGDSMPQDLARQVSAKSPKNASADDDDSDCDSDASGEYEPLREPSTSRLSVRSASPPPPLPPPRPRCNSFHARRPSTDSVSGKAGGHFGEPPQASQSLGDLSTVPAEPAPAARQTSFYRFLASHRPAAPKRLALLWRRKSDRTTRSDKVFDDPDVTLNKSMPNLRSGTPKAWSWGRMSAPVAVVTPVAKNAPNAAADSPCSISPKRIRPSSGVFHRALSSRWFASFHERTSQRHRRSFKDQANVVAQAPAPVSPSAAKKAAEDWREKPEPSKSCKEAFTTETRQDDTEGDYLEVEPRGAFESAYFQLPEYAVCGDRLGQSVPNINQLTSPVYELMVKPPSIIVNCPEGGSLGQDHLARDCPQGQSQQEDDEGYMTMDAIHVILGSPTPPSPLLGAPDVSTPPSADLESCYLDMTGVERLRLAHAFDACRNSAEVKPPALPARPSLRGRSLRTAALRHASGDKIYYSNLDDFHLALQALQFESRPAIAEDE